MPRKKLPQQSSAPTEASTPDNTRTATATVTAEPPPAMTNEAQAPAEGAAAGKNYGSPYRPIFGSTAKGFEMGEDRRFKQRVFKFKDKPDEQTLAALKQAGFIYRPEEKAWTVHANPVTRKLSDILAKQFAGQASGMTR